MTPIAYAKAIGGVVLLAIAVVALAWLKSWYDDRLTLPYRNQVITANARAEAAQQKLVDEVDRVEKLLAADRVALQVTIADIETQRNDLQNQLAATATDRLCSGPDARQLLDDAIDRSNARAAPRPRPAVRPVAPRPDPAPAEKQGITDAEWRSWASAMTALRTTDRARFERVVGIIEASPCHVIVDGPREQ